MKITPRIVVIAFVAVLITIKVGPALSQAKRKATFPLLGECTTFFGVIGNGITPEIMAGFLECSLGAFLYIMLPGLGIGWMIFKRSQ